MGDASREELRELIQRSARESGFDAVGIAGLDHLDPQIGERLQRFVAAGHHGSMTWLSNTLDRRRHPKALWPAAQSAVMLGLSYAPPRDPLLGLAERSRAIISCYAKGRDYHDVIKPALKRVAGALQRATGADVKVFVDTAPLMEKPLATAGGLGWQGRHTNLVSRAHGSWLLLGAVLTTALLPADTPESDHCGTCRRCLDICPTEAFPAPYQLDARRCISYLTIEHKGPIPRDLRAKLANRVFGCDDCLAVCPWNKFATAARDQRLAARSETDDPPIVELLALDDAGFRRRFAGTPIRRTGRDRLVRNALIAAGNSSDKSLSDAIICCLDDPSPLVRGAAVWALSRIVDAPVLKREREARLPDEPDPDVREEWHVTVELNAS